MNIFQENFVSPDYLRVTYYLKSKTTLRNAAWELAIGQSVGNPNVRSKWETEELFENHSCIVCADEKQLEMLQSGIVHIAFPLANINMKEDGVSQLLCQIMGGQLDIDDIEECHLLDINWEEARHIPEFLGPKFGISGIREYVNIHDTPLLGGIIKPKIVTSPEMLLDMVKEMVDGGINFIKEDEIMSNPAICPLNKRLPLVMNYLDGKNVIYAACINADSPYLYKRVMDVYQMGGNAIHVNFWSGLGAYKAIRAMELPLFLHFQKSGDKILTNTKHAFHINWEVICELAGLMGADFIHAGMWGGYSSQISSSEMQTIMDILHGRRTMPALSCGMHPGLVQAITDKFGIDYMANVGGALHGHPGGTTSGVRAMRQAIDGNYGLEYEQAIAKWGKMK